jgi:septal ring factor EnvC (AmiA/AmiB activator)
MASDDRLVRIMAELLTEVNQMRTDNNERLDKTNDRLNRLETKMSKNTAAVGELRLSVMNVSEKIEEIHELDKRVRVLENIVLPKSPQQAA